MGRKFQITIEIEDEVEVEQDNNIMQIEAPVAEEKPQQPYQFLHNQLVSSSQFPSSSPMTPAQFSNQIVSGILNDIAFAYQQQPNKHNQSSNSDNINYNQASIVDLAKASGLEVIRQVNFKHYFTQKESRLTHLRVLQQFVPNLCGYHASLNMLLVLDALKSAKQMNNSGSALKDTPTEILQHVNSSASFWKFHKETTDFLWQFKLAYRGDHDKFPWRENDIRTGDFERNYLQASLGYNKRFKDSLTSSKVSGAAVHIEYATWEYQFGRSVQSEANRNELTEKINAFIQFKKQDQSYVLAMMLGVTNHWGSLVAHKLNGNVEFVFLDSRNRDYLEWNEADILAWMKEQEIKREKMGQKPWTDFDRLVQKQCVFDIQESLQNICDCLLGNMTLADCGINSSFLMFEKQFEAAVSYEKILNGEDLRNQLALSEVFAKDFYHSVNGFFKIKNALKHLTDANAMKYTQFKTVFAKIHATNKLLNPSSHHRSYIDPLYNLLERAKL